MKIFLRTLMLVVFAAVLENSSTQADYLYHSGYYTYNNGSTYWVEPGGYYAPNVVYYEPAPAHLLSTIVNTVI